MTSRMVRVYLPYSAPSVVRHAVVTPRPGRSMETRGNEKATIGVTPQAHPTVQSVSHKPFPDSAVDARGPPG